VRTAFVTVSDGRAATVVPLNGDAATGALSAGFSAGGVTVVVGAGVGAVGEASEAGPLEQAGSATAAKPISRSEAHVARTVIIAVRIGRCWCGSSRNLESSIYSLQFYDGPPREFALFTATAARTRAFNAFASIVSPCRKSMARRVFPSRLELKRRDGSSTAAPFANVTFTTFL
jgi:hypothetical protein